MPDRLVLGCSSLGRTIVEEVADRPGGVRVVTDDENRAETLVAGGVPVTTGDPGAVETLRALDPPDVVVVAGGDPGENVAAARAARQAFPGAVLVAYAGQGATGHAARLDDIADRVVDPAREVSSFLLDRVGDDATRLWQLQRVLRGIDRLAIVAHDNPDPDAIASATALARLAERVDCEPEVCYFGEISHQENRAFVNLLGLDLKNLDPDADLSAYDGFALVDHSRPGANDQLPEDLSVDVVIDHHPPRGPVEATFVDLRSEAGATSTLLVDYLDNLGVPLTEELATGLLFGIRVDTDEFTRETSPADLEATATLLPHADLGTLERVGSPSISLSTFETIADAIANRRHEGQVVVTSVSRLSDRDALAQAADRLLALEGVTTTVVYGVRDRTVYVSARSRGTDLDLGETLRDAFGPIGSAGGHADMAGAQITLGVLEAVEAVDGSLLEVLGSVVADRFFDALDTRLTQPAPGAYASEHGADRYLVPSEERPVLESDASPDRGRTEPSSNGDDGA